jgi:hypothetical protein
MGTCKLCGDADVVLQQSHLLPAAAYYLLRGSKDGDTDPILGQWTGETGALVQTSKEVQDYVFCAKCEHLFNVGGEEWISTQLAEGPASPLFYALSPPPLYSEPNGSFAIYATANIPEFDRKEIIHFAMGVLFKAGVHPWPVGKQKRKLYFGKYLEPIRQFVLGTGGFPPATTLAFSLFPPIEGPKTMSIPYEWKGDRCHTYSFSVCGLEFVLSLGRGIPDWLRRTCFVSDPRRPVLVTSHTLQLMMNNSMRVIEKGGVKGKLRNAIPKRDR